MRRTIVLVAVLLVSCTSSIAPSPTPATNTGVTSLAPSPTSSATIAAIVTAPPANASPTPIPLPSFADIAAAGSGVVWVLVADQHLFRSLDRGATWEERDVPQLPLGPMKNISFVDDRDGWLLTVGSPATGCMAQGFTVWRTTDGASTWERAHQATFSSSPLAGGCKSRAATYRQRCFARVTVPRHGRCRSGCPILLDSCSSPQSHRSNPVPWATLALSCWCPRARS